jgi:hypothetical protein
MRHQSIIFQGLLSTHFIGPKPTVKFRYGYEYRGSWGDPRRRQGKKVSGFSVREYPNPQFPNTQYPVPNTQSHPTSHTTHRYHRLKGNCRIRSGRGRKKREPSVLGTSIPAALSNNLVKGVCPGRGMPRKKNAGFVRDWALHRVVLDNGE